jgi:hypothetical protein
MEKTLTADPQAESSAEEVTDYKADIAEIFAQMEQIDKRIKRNQAETEQLRAETQVMFAQMQAA